MVMPTLLYSSKTFTLNSNQIKLFDSTEMRFLRRVLGVSLLDHVRSDTIRQQLEVGDVGSIVEVYREK